MKNATLIILSAVTLCVLAGCDKRAPANNSSAAPPGVHANESSMEQDLEQLQNLAAKGDAEAQFNLGWIYMHGEGFTGAVYVREIPRDVARSFEWYEKAAGQGHVKAQYNLGMLYKLGMGVAKDAEKAYVWLQKAAAQGNDIAQYNLGVMYADGSGVKRNLTKACTWLVLAAAQGNEKAKNNYFEIDAKLDSKQRTECQQFAVAWKKGEII